MSDTNEEYKFIFDLSDIEKAEKAFIDAFNAFQDQFLAYEAKGLKVNEANELISASLRAIGKDGREATVFMEKFGNILKETSVQWKQLEEAKDTTVKDTAALVKDAAEKEKDTYKALYEAEFRELVKKEKQEEQIKKAQFDYAVKLAQQEEQMKEELYKREFRALQQKEAEELRIKAISQQRDIEMYNNQARLQAQNSARLERELALASGGGGGAGTQALGFVGGALSQAAGQLMAKAFTEVSMAARQSIQDAEQLEIEIGRIAAVSNDASKTTEQWAQNIVDLSNKYGASANDVAGGTFKALTSNAGRNGDVNEIMDAALQLSAATGASTAETTKLITNSMNAFGKSTSDAGQIAADFFKLVRSGSVDVGELSGSLGNVQALAGKVGVSFEDVNAAIAAMSNQGLNTTTSVKYLTEVLNLTLKPSKQMQEAFEALRVTSFSSLVDLKGFGGAIQDIANIAKEKSLDELSSQLGSFKTARGLALFTGNGVKDFDDALKNTHGTVNELKSAMEAAFGTPGKMLEVEANKLKNTFMQDFGEPMVRVLGVVAKEFNSLFEYFEHISAVTFRNVAENFDAYQKQTNDVLETSLKQQEGYYNDLERKINNGIDEEARHLLNGSADVRKSYTDMANNVKHSFEEINESLKTSFTRTIDGVKNNIKDLTKDISDANATIKESIKFSQDLTANEDRRGFNASLEGKSSPEQIQLLQQRARQLQDQADQAEKRFLNATDPSDRQDAHAEMRDRSKEAADLIEEAHKLEVQAAKEIEKYNKERIHDMDIIAEKQKALAEENQRYQEKQLELARKFQRAEDEQAQKVYDNNQKLIRGGAKNFVKNLGNAQTADTHALIAFNNKDEDLGAAQVRLAQEHARKIDEINSKTDAEKAKVQEVVGKLNEANKAHDLALSIEEERAQLTEHRLALEKEIQANAAAALVTAKQQKEEKEASLKDLEQLSTEAIKVKPLKKGDASDYTKQLQDFKELEAKIDAAEGKAGVSLGDHLQIQQILQEKEKDLALSGSKAFTDQIDEYNKKVKAAAEEIKNSEKSVKDDLFSKLQEETKRYKTVVDALKAITDQPGFASKTLETALKNLNDPNVTADARAGILASIEPLLKQFKAQDTATGDGAAIISIALNAIDSFKKIDAEIKDDKLAIKDFELAYAETMQKNTAVTETEVKKQIESFRELKQALVDLGRDRDAFEKANAAPTAVAPSAVGAGADSIPQDFGQSVQGSAPDVSGDTPSAGTRNVVGDIHVHVAGGSTAPETVRQIAKGLKRELHRGGISKF